MNDAGGRFKVGDRVRVIATPHAGMEGMTIGTVSEVSDQVPYAIQFEGMEEPHKWYVDNELAPAPDDAQARASAERARAASIYGRFNARIPQPA